MGVTRNRDEPRPIRIEDSVDNFNYQDFDLTEESEVESLPPTDPRCAAEASRSQRRKEARAERRMRRFLDAVHTDGVHIKPRMGARKWRRVENARAILSMTEEEDIVTDCSDLVEQTVTAFDRLFIDENNMKLWQKFVEKSEEDQRRIIASCSRPGLSTIQEESSSDEWCMLGGERKVGGSPPKSKSARKVPFSSDSCYKRLAPRFKQLFARKKLPWGVVARTEDELRSFFNDTTDGIWIGNFPSSLHRMLVHGTAQYLQLLSRSVTEEASSERLTEVRNSRHVFLAPEERLIPYLERLHGYELEVVDVVEGVS